MMTSSGATYIFQHFIQIDRIGEFEFRYRHFDFDLFQEILRSMQCGTVNLRHQLV